MKRSGNPKRGSVAEPNQHGREKPSKRQIRFHERLMCFVLDIDYHFQTRTGNIYMQPSNCVDKEASIELFLKIDPKVEAIVTWAGDQRDTSYHLVNGEWADMIPAKMYKTRSDLDSTLTTWDGKPHDSIRWGALRGNTLRSVRDLSDVELSTEIRYYCSVLGQIGEDFYNEVQKMGFIECAVNSLGWQYQLSHEIIPNGRILFPRGRGS